MSQRVTYRCSGCGKRLLEQRGRAPAALRHMLGSPGDRSALLCGLFVRTKTAPRELRNVWRDLPPELGAKPTGYKLKLLSMGRY